MFTGLVEELGVVRAVTAGPGTVRLEIAATTVLGDAPIGASIAVNGACLTVVATGDGWWAADVVPETLARTNLGGLAPGSAVNLERAMPAGGRMGGHIVLGHVDATVALLAIRPFEDGAAEIDVELPGAYAALVVEKGSVTLDGVSLTVARVGDGRFTIALIPHTRAVTTFAARTTGDLLNLEVDYLAKLVARLADPYLTALAPTGGGGDR
jgi:riboflavin synthase